MGGLCHSGGLGCFCPQGSRVARSSAQKSPRAHGCASITPEGLPRSLLWALLMSAAVGLSPPLPSASCRRYAGHSDEVSDKTLLLFQFWLNRHWFCQPTYTGRACCFQFWVISILSLSPSPRPIESLLFPAAWYLLRGILLPPRLGN